MESSHRIRDGASREISQRVTTFLSRAPETARQFQLELNRGLLDARDPLAVEAALFSLLLSNRDIGELTFTYGEKTGFDAEGMLQLAPTPRGQISVVRGSIGQEEEHWWSRHIKQEAVGFVSERRELESSARFSALPLHRESRTDIPDPTTHPTFTTPAQRISLVNSCGATCTGRSSTPNSRPRNAGRKSACSKP